MPDNVISLDEFLELSKYIDLCPKRFKVDRLKEIKQIVEAAKEHVSRLAFSKAVHCDICVYNFFPKREAKKAIKIRARIFAEAWCFSSRDMTREILEKLYPDYSSEPSGDGRIRIHGFTQAGEYQTYCHFCDDDVCLSQVREGKDWDSAYREQYRNFIPKLPELLGIAWVPAVLWEETTDLILAGKNFPEVFKVVHPKVLGFHFSGSTSWSVAVDILVPAGEMNRTYVFYAHEGKRWSISVVPEDDPLVEKLTRRMYKL